MTLMPRLSSSDLQIQQVAVMRKIRKPLNDLSNRPPKKLEKAREEVFAQLLQAGGANLRATEFAPVLSKTGSYQQMFALIDRPYVIAGQIDS
jgi:hypothetical protein